MARGSKQSLGKSFGVLQLALLSLSLFGFESAVVSNLRTQVHCLWQFMLLQRDLSISCYRMSWKA